MKMKTSLTVLLVMELLGLSSALIKQHFFVNQEKNIFHARWHCRRYYNDLSTFTNYTEEQQFRTDAANQSSNAWIGLYMRSDFWSWLGVKNTTPISWDTSMQQPDNTPYERCAFLYNNTKAIHDENCYNELAFFCMTVSAVVQEAKSWDGALDYCRRQDRDLASLSSTYKMNSALRSVAQAQTDYVWVGLRFLAGNWTWISGEEFDTTSMVQCPARNLRCGALNKNTKVWTPRDCEEQLNFICQ